ncbi:hypothetical protein GGH93_004756 [Coemansia aciculifera]|nr:hypothetical protein GGH93_004756 [Coemansia aciculifera]
MAYRKRSLDLPVSEDSPASIKHARSSNSSSSSSRPPLTVSTALEPAAASGDYNGGALPPIRSLTGLALPSPAIPSFRHFHTSSSGASNSPVSSNVRQQQQEQLSSGLTAGLSQLSYARTAPPAQPSQHPQSAYPGHSYNPPPSAHYTYAPPQPQPHTQPQPPPPPPPPPSYYRSHTDHIDQANSMAAHHHHGSSPISSTQSDRSPHVQPVSREMTRTGGMELIHTAGGESATVAAMAQLEMMDGGIIGSPPEAVKVARNWSREETLSLVRAIKRHYEALKRCKTNQERSNVWHRIHKEHSSQFPGRSKKASQDRWGKVLSDYKDVMVHNKEKGAARWTFDFFKEVAGIVEGDTQYIDSAMSPPSSSVTTTSSTAGRALPPASADDLSLYSFGAAAPSSARSYATGSSTALPTPAITAGSSGPPNSSTPRPPIAHHRMSEPNLSLLSTTAKHDSRFMPHHHRPPPPPPLSVHGRHSGTLAMHIPQHRPPMQHHHSQQLSPVDVHSSTFDNRQPTRYSPPRRTSYPQLQYQQQLLSAQANAASRAGRGSYHTFRYYPQLGAGAAGAVPPLSPQQQQQQIGEPESSLPQQRFGGDGASVGVLSKQQIRVHSWAPSTVSAIATPAVSAPETNMAVVEKEASPANVVVYPLTSGLESGSRPATLSPDLPLTHNNGDPEDTCRQVLDILSQQMRRIDAEQDNLVRLKESTQNTMNKVEQIMQMYIQPPPPPPSGSDDSHR